MPRKSTADAISERKIAAGRDSDGTHQVEDLPSDDEDVKYVHDFLGRRGVLSIKNAEDVNVRRA